MKLCEEVMQHGFAESPNSHHGANMLIPGSCHCKNIQFTLQWDPEPSQIPARACTCSFCTKHGGVWTSCPTGALKIAVHDSSLVTRYAFGTKTAVFHVCAQCGVVPVVTCEIDAHVYAVVNVNAFEGLDSSLLSKGSASFDGEGQDERLARRKRNWIPRVEYVTSIA